MMRETADPIDWSHPHPHGKYPLSSSCFERLHYHLCKISALLNEPKICAPNDFPQLTLNNTLHSVVINWPSRLLFLSCPIYFFPYSPYLLSFLACFFILLHSCCSHCTSVWEDTRAWVPHSLFLLRQCNYKYSMVEIRTRY